jgi:hypothetical protein
MSYPVNLRRLLLMVIRHGSVFLFVYRSAFDTLSRFVISIVRLSSVL